MLFKKALVKDVKEEDAIVKYVDECDFELSSAEKEMYDVKNRLRRLIS